MTTVEVVTDGNRRLANLKQKIPRGKIQDYYWVLSRDVADALERGMGLGDTHSITQWLGLPVVILSGGFANVQRYINLDNDPRNMPKL